MLARRKFASQQFENVDSLARFACAGSSGRNSEEICKADQFSSLGAGGKCGRSTEQQRNAAGRLKEVLLLPAVMVAEQIPMVGKKTDENVIGVWPRFDCIEDSPQTIIQVRDLAIVT